jgi:xanthine dehydrogenase accessory factor
MAATLLDLVRDIGWRGELVDGSAFASAMVTPTSVVIVATQGHGDEEALESALAASPAFVGLVASRKRGDVVRGYLADRGASQLDLARVQVPIGLDLGHTTHREIAVSILAELVQLRAAGQLKPHQRAMLPMLEPQEVIDLVCGMTVQAVPANRPFVHEGTTYYFCAMGCRVAFEKNPGSFIHQEATC